MSHDWIDERQSSFKMASMGSEQSRRRRTQNRFSLTCAALSTRRAQKANSYQANHKKGNDMNKICTSLVYCTILAAFTSSAVGLTFTEDFNSYPAGSTTWGGLWNDPTDALKLDSYTMDGTLGPRTGGTALRSAHAVLGQTGVAPLSFSADFFWSSANCKNDAFFVVLSDDPATALSVPTNLSSTAAPINAIAWGHTASGSSDYRFFDGQSWALVGNSDGSEVMHGTVDAAGNWSAEVVDPSSAVSGLLAAINFSFDTVSVISEGSSGDYSGIDNIYVVAAVPEPHSALIVALGLVGFAAWCCRRQHS